MIQHEMPPLNYSDVVKRVVGRKGEESKEQLKSKYTFCSVNAQYFSWHENGKLQFKSHA